MSRVRFWALRVGAGRRCPFGEPDSNERTSSCRRRRERAGKRAFGAHCPRSRFLDRSAAHVPGRRPHPCLRLRLRSSCVGALPRLRGRGAAGPPRGGSLVRVSGCGRGVCVPRQTQPESAARRHRRTSRCAELPCPRHGRSSGDPVRRVRPHLPQRREHALRLRRGVGRAQRTMRGSPRGNRRENGERDEEP